MICHIGMTEIVRDINKTFGYVSCEEDMLVLDVLDYFSEEVVGGEVY